MAYVVASAPHIAVSVHSAGLACCAVEFTAAVARGLLEPASDRAPEPALHVLVIAGTVTTAMAPALMSAWQALPEPKQALALGACATSGGPYWDSYSVVPGASALLPVHSYVPGCPPRPEALVEAICALHGSGAAA